jgi:hypothetical protein
MRKSKWERRSLCAPGASSISIPIPPVPGRRPLAVGRRLLLACVCSLALAALLPGAALADTMSLGLSAEAVQSATTQITYTASSEELGFVTLAVNNADVPCGSTPEADAGTELAGPALEAPGQTGVYSGSVNYTPSEPGVFIICGWVTGYGVGSTTGGPTISSASLPIEVRLPHISLALGLANPVAAGKQFALDLTVTSEVPREVILIGVAYTPAGCPVDSAASTAAHLIDSVFEGGPSLKSVTVNPLPAGSRWLECAYAVVPGAINPQATTSMIVNVPHALPRSKPKRRKQKPKRRKQGRATREARACGTMPYYRITGTIKATGISCKQADGVFLAVEEAPLSSDILETPYYTYSPPYSVSTEAGRFTCRREPFGLAGSEHNIHCKQGKISVSWSTIHD